MTKSELINALAARFPQLAVRDVDMAVDTILRSATQSLCEAKRLEIRGFGSFSITQRAARVARNPKTGESLLIPPKSVPHFKPGKELRQMVDQTFKSTASQLHSNTVVNK